ncbi:GNAT family N-acetyltransferase [Halovulum dunhuangense]|uniref:GNAT family N-acetyltransferase n=1 Tax=Halovulum dunhuangense TaxID=1505036 RepID=A0A849KX20_9RHOB|nr:GNAT family N-acetyltransferase [Halovulum dunhuangense]NNU78947.1 GNAT family N-acetyltransferase [Halovulum dunhuangense]
MSAAIRPFRPEDAAALAALFHRAVTQGAAAFYDDAQRAAWSPAPPDAESFAARLAPQTVFVAAEEGAALGFMSLTGAGHLDMAFVAPERMGTGLAGQLYDHVERAALKAGHARLTTDASHPARRFFARRGWRVLRRQAPVRNGVALTNFAMEKRLS